MPRVSIVIPFLSSDDPLEETLVSVLSNRPKDSEVIVVHRGRYDDPYDLAEEVRFVHAAPTASMTEAVNRSFAIAKGDVIHLLACGMEADDGWVEPAIAHFDDVRVGMVTPLHTSGNHLASAGVKMSVTGQRIECGTDCVYQCGLRPSLDPSGPTHSAAFYRRSAIQACGGFSERAGDANADLDLALTLLSLGFVGRFEPECRVRGPAVKTTPDSAFTNGRHAQQLVLRHTGWLKTLTLHAWEVGLETASRFWMPATWSKLMGRAAACLDIRSYRNEPRELAATEPAEQSAWHRVESPHCHQPSTASHTADKRQSA